MMNQEKWFARVIWNDSEGGIISEHVFDSYEKADIFRQGFNAAKVETEAHDFEDQLENHFVDVTQVEVPDPDDQPYKVKEN